MGCIDHVHRDAFERVARWRWRGLGGRVGDILVFGLLAWLLTRSSVVYIWAPATILVAVIEAELFRRLLQDGTDRRMERAALAALAVSATSFSGFALIVESHHSSVSLVGAGLALCAVNLNNAVMSRGWWRVCSVAIAPSTLLIVAAPATAALFGYHLTFLEGAILELGALAYVAFVGRLVGTLRREGWELACALERLEQQRDAVRLAKEEADRARAHWRMLFEQSPLPQVCFDASRLYELLKGFRAGGVDRLGDVLGARSMEVPDIFRQFTLMEVNAATARLFGVDSFEGRIDLKHFHPSFVRGLCASLNGVGADGVLPPFEAKIIRADGSAADVLVHVRNIDDGGLPWSTCISTYVDVTEARRAERAQREAMRSAEAANRSKSEFLANISHEIRTPLNGVLGMAQAMEAERLSKRQRQALAVIRQSGATLLALLNQVLDLSKIEAGKLELEERDFELDLLADELRCAFAELAVRKGLRFTVELDPQARGGYRGDPLRVRQVLSNLLSNALKFTAQGGVTLTITRQEHGLTMVVDDTGIGVRQDRLDRLFEKFAQADSSTTREFGGTGLGLAICRELCAAMGGSIRAEGEPRRGSRFIVELPLPRSGSAAVPDRGDSPSLGRADRPLRILAAEDNAVNQLVLSTLLGQLGLEPALVGDGQAAVRAWEAGDWDLILMDVQMPVMDGPTAARAIRAMEQRLGRPRTPIIALTANAMVHQADAYRAAGMDGVVAKPIEVGLLIKAIEEATSVSDAAPEALRPSLA